MAGSVGLQLLDTRGRNPAYEPWPDALPISISDEEKINLDCWIRKRGGGEKEGKIRMYFVSQLAHLGEFFMRYGVLYEQNQLQRRGGDGETTTKKEKGFIMSSCFGLMESDDQMEDTGALFFRLNFSPFTLLLYPFLSRFFCNF